MEMILDNCRSTIREVADDVGIWFGSCQAIFTDVLGMKCAAVKIAPKLLNFEQKQCSMDVTQEMLTAFIDDSDLLKKVITCDDSWLYGYDIETEAQSSQWKRPEGPRLKKVRKVSYMWKFCSLFSLNTMAWCIMNFCHSVVRSIWNTTLKLYADCWKQFVRNAQNCGKTNHEFYTMLAHQLTHRFLCVSFWPNSKP